MNSKILLVGLIVSLLLSAGCSARKDKKNEEFPDEFARGIDHAEKNPVDFMEMDGTGEDLSFQDKSSSGLIAAADRKNPIQDDTAPSIPKSLDSQGSIWDSPGGTSNLAPDSIAGFESIDENDFDETAPIIGGAPIGGGMVPPRADGPSATAPTAPSSGLAGGAGATAPAGASFDGGSPGLELKSAPPRLLADAGSAPGATYPPFRPPGGLSLDANIPAGNPTGNLELRNPLEDFTPSSSGIESGAGALSSSSGNGGSRAAQAIGSSAAGGAPAASDSALGGAAGTISLEGLRPDAWSGADSSPTSTAMQAGRSTANLPDAKTLKQQGINQYKDRDFDAAVTSFRDYLSAYTEEEEAVRAWLGYALMQDRRFGEASKEFDILLNSGNSELRADAHYYLGLIHEKQGDFEAARVRWEQVVESYPNSQAAEKARKSLGQSSP